LIADQRNFMAKYLQNGEENCTKRYTVVKKLAEMSVKNDASGGVDD